SSESREEDEEREPWKVIGISWPQEKDDDKDQRRRSRYFLVRNIKKDNQNARATPLTDGSKALRELLIALLLLFPPSLPPRTEGNENSEDSAHARPYSSDASEKNQIRAYRCNHFNLRPSLCPRGVRQATDKPITRKVENFQPQEMTNGAWLLRTSSAFASQMSKTKTFGRNSDKELRRDVEEELRRASSSVHEMVPHCRLLQAMIQAPKGTEENRGHDQYGVSSRSTHGHRPQTFELLERPRLSLFFLRSGTRYTFGHGNMLINKTTRRADSTIHSIYTWIATIPRRHVHRGDLIVTVRPWWYVHDDVYGDLFLAVSRLTLHPWQLAPVVQNTVFTDHLRNHPGVRSLIRIRSMSMTARPRRESEQDTSGFVFNKCVIKGTGKTFLGRAYRGYSRVVFYGTHMSNVVVPQGWDAWHYKGQEDKFIFVEVNSTGKGANKKGRVGWEKNLSAKEVDFLLNPKTFVDKDGWMATLPSSLVSLY
ncbi:unnamed protein product, partial [Brassica oleracea var. botrytis]